MKIKRFIALLLSVATIMAFSSCSKDKTEVKEETKQDNTSSVMQSVSEDAVVDDEVPSVIETESETEIITENDDEDLSDIITQPEIGTVTITQKEETAKHISEKTEKNTKPVANTTKKSDDNPADWNKEKIASFYKTAAKKTHSEVKSSHKIEIKKISVNNGEFEGLFDFIMPIMSKLLANNSEDKDGITGGYSNLTASDIASAKAYKSGENTVVEMIMKEQVSGPKEDANSGSVGHAITAVGDISVVTDQLADLKLPLEISDKHTKIYYTNPTVKVVINENGKIVNGTWKYTVEIRLDNYKAFGKDVETTSVT